MIPLAPLVTDCIGEKGGKDLWPYWVPVLTFETTLVMLAAVKSVQCALSSYGTCRTLRVLVRDSVLYFGGTAACMLVNFVIWVAARVGCPPFLRLMPRSPPSWHVQKSLTGIATSPVLVAYSVLGCRLLVRSYRQLGQVALLTSRLHHSITYARSCDRSP